MGKLIAYEYNGRLGGDRFNALDQAVADSDLVCATEQLAEALSSKGHRVYRYFYNHQASTDPWPSWSGVKHGSELELTFGLPISNPTQYKAEEIKLTHDILTYWLNFAQTGRPDENGSWPKYQDPDWTFINLTASAVCLTGSATLNGNCKFWNDVVPPLLEKLQG